MEDIKKIVEEMRLMKQLLTYQTQNNKLLLLEIQAIRRILEKQWQV